ncbi:M20 family peptidase [Larkinella soli]|uniref:M20 family peptidase n=1 Tax=Larkinella soli TaxID=1770527 RepID=UPI000FFC44CB|nr:M20 family peptidase [Larkinella soli]
MKKFLRWFLLGLFLLAVILVINTFRFSSRQLTGVAPAPPVAVGDSAVDRFAQALRYRTVSFTDYSLTDTTQFEAFGAFLKRSFPLMHSRLKLETFNRYGLLYEWKGRNPALKPILLMAHYDVVPVIQGTERMWPRPPFAGRVDGGIIYGRGTRDDKGCVMAISEAVEWLLKGGFQPERTVYLAFGQDEETLGKRGAEAIAKAFKQRNIDLEYVLDEGGTVKTDGIPGLKKPVALVGISEKGYVSLELTVVASGGHSSMPPPQTSIGMVAEAVDRLQKNPFPARLDAGLAQMFAYTGPEMSFGQRLVFANDWLFAPLVKRIIGQTNSGNALIRTTTAPTIFKAGAKDNVLPIDATATVNFRILPGESIASVTKRVKEVIDNEQVKVTVMSASSTEPSPLSDPDDPAFTKLHRTIKSVFPEVVVTPFLVLGGTDSKYFARICPNVYRFSPMLTDEASIPTIHGTNERMPVDDYRNMIRFYVTLIRNSQN